MSADNTTANPAVAINSFAFPRHEQTFPTLTPQEIDRMRRFGEVVFKGRRSPVRDRQTGARHVRGAVG
jgi:hypothetical protein